MGSGFGACTVIVEIDSRWLYLFQEKGYPYTSVSVVDNCIQHTNVKSSDIKLSQQQILDALYAIRLADHAFDIIKRDTHKYHARLAAPMVVADVRDELHKAGIENSPSIRTQEF